MSKHRAERTKYISVTSIISLFTVWKQCISYA